MAQMRRPLTAGFLSMLLPGAGQLYLGLRRRGALLLGLAALAGVLLLAVAAARPDEVVGSLDRRVLAWFLVADAALLALRIFAAGWVAVRGYGVLDAVFADAEPADVLPASGGVLLAAPPAQRVLPHHEIE